MHCRNQIELPYQVDNIRLTVLLSVRTQCSERGTSFYNPKTKTVTCKMKNSTVALKTGEDDQKNQNSCRAQREHLGKKRKCYFRFKDWIGKQIQQSQQQIPERKIRFLTLVRGSVRATLLFITIFAPLFLFFFHKSCKFSPFTPRKNSLPSTFCSTWIVFTLKEYNWFNGRETIPHWDSQGN